MEALYYFLEGEDGDFLSAHAERLFDQDEDINGDLYSLITGERIDNSTYTGLEGLNIIDGEKLEATYFFLPDDDTLDMEGWARILKELRQNQPLIPKSYRSSTTDDYDSV
jgi:hypothetical protein